MNRIVLTTKYTEGGTQMRHVFDELEAQGLKPKMLFKKDHDEIIFGVPTVEPQEWISVKDRLPELRQNVLVTYADGDVETNERMALKGIEVWKYGGNVVAWMPLPEPYKGDKE